MRRPNRFNLIVLVLILGGVALYAGQARKEQILLERAKQKASERVTEQSKAPSKPQASPSPGATAVPDEPTPEPLSFAKRRHKVCQHGNLDLDPKGYARLRKGTAEQLFLRGVAYDSRHQYERALDDFQAALDKRSQDPRFYGHIASLYDSMENHQKALTFIEVALQRDPDYYMYYADRGWYHSKLGNQKQAEADWTTFLSVQPKERHEFAALAAEYERRNLPEMALPLAEKTIEMDRAWGSYLTKGKALRKLGQNEAALSAVLDGLKQTPWSVDLHQEAAELYQERGESAKADGHLAEVERLKVEVLE